MDSESPANSRRPPHPVLTDYYASESERPRQVRRLFDGAADHYDWIERAMSFNTGSRYRRQALKRAGLGAGMEVLDVGSGTGVIAAQAAAMIGPQGRVVALDASLPMLARARARRVRSAVQGLGERLPFADRSFDLLILGYALRHMEDLSTAFEEFRRVLRPGGRVLMLEITAPRSRTAQNLLRLYLKRLVPAAVRVCRRSPEAGRLMSYYWDTIEYCVPPSAILDALCAAGFENVRRSVVLGLFSEYVAVRV